MSKSIGYLLLRAFNKELPMCGLNVKYSSLREEVQWVKVEEKPDRFPKVKSLGEMLIGITDTILILYPIKRHSVRELVVIIAIVFIRLAAMLQRGRNDA